MLYDVVMIVNIQEGQAMKKILDFYVKHVQGCSKCRSSECGLEPILYEQLLRAEAEQTKSRK